MKYTVSLVLVMLVIGTRLREANAELRVANIFADHMVLQRDRPIDVWGWSENRDEVTVAFAGQTRETLADKNGTWSVKLNPLTAESQGRSLQVASRGQSIAFHDVLVGEVWHASGQSNMAMTVGAMASELDVAQADIAAANRRFEEGGKQGVVLVKIND